MANEAAILFPALFFSSGHPFSEAANTLCQLVYRMNQHKITSQAGCTIKNYGADIQTEILIYQSKATLDDVKILLGEVTNNLGYVHTAPFSFLSVFVDETLSIPIVPLSNEYAMKMIGVRTAPAKRCC